MRSKESQNFFVFVSLTILLPSLQARMGPSVHAQYLQIKAQIQMTITHTDQNAAISN